MQILLHPTHAPLPSIPCETLLRDLKSLLVTSRSITESLRVLRPECAFSPELTEKVAGLIAVSQKGEARLSELLGEAGIILPTETEAGTIALVGSLFSRLPAGAAPRNLATEVGVNLRLLAQHLELKARLAAEAALLAGQESLRRALLAWALGLCACGQSQRSMTFRARAQAYVADLDEACVLAGGS